MRAAITPKAGNQETGDTQTPKTHVSIREKFEVREQAFLSEFACSSLKSAGRHQVGGTLRHPDPVSA